MRKDYACAGPFQVFPIIFPIVCPKWVDTKNWLQVNFLSDPFLGIRRKNAGKTQKGVERRRGTGFDIKRLIFRWFSLFCENQRMYRVFFETLLNPYIKSSFWETWFPRWIKNFFGALKFNSVMFYAFFRIKLNGNWI